MSFSGGPTFVEMNKSLNDKRRNLARIDAVQERYIDEKADLITKMSGAERYLDNKDETLAVLEKTLAIVQTQSKALFEELLTQLIRDIMPHNTDRVVLDAGVSRNRATLEFLSRNSAGFFENIYYDCGGSIHNIISVGLRFIVLSRTANRRILFLDEPDCWMNPKYIPTFMSIVESLSERVGVQVVFISHYEADYTKMAGQHIHLRTEDGVVTTDVAYSSDKAAMSEKASGIGDEAHVGTMMDGVGWEYIRLTNIKSHESTLIELSPTMNYLSGDNNVGKSHVIRAVSAMLGNNGTESLIMHGKSEARLEIGLEEGMTLVWTYRRTGSRKTKYELLDAEGAVIKSSSDGKGVPDWLHEYLAMAPVNGLDVHIADQNESNFLIDRGTSSHDRAKALSLGRDAQLVQRMIALHGEKCTQARRDLNEGQKSLRAVKNKLSVFQHNAAIMDELDRAEKMLSQAQAADSRLKEIGACAKQISSLNAKIEALSGFKEAPVVRVPQVVDGADLGSTIDKIEKKRQEINALSKIKESSTPVVPGICPEEELTLLAKKLSGLNLRTAILRQAVNQISPAPIPDVKPLPLDEVNLTGAGLEEKRKNVERLKARLNEAIQAEEAESSSRERLVAETGYCPFCNREHNVRMQHEH